MHTLRNGYITAANELIEFRQAFHPCCTRGGDALFELTDAALCASGPVGSVPTLSLEPEFTRFHGSLYKSLARGRIDEDRLRRLLVAHRPTDGPMVFAVDASVWDRCDAECSPGRGFYYSASKHSAGQPIVAGWSFQWISQLSGTPHSWTAPVDVGRIGPREDTTDATIDQVRRAVDLLPGDGEVLSSFSTPATTPSASPMASPTPGPRCCAGSATTASSTPTRPPGPGDPQGPGVGHPVTGGG